MEKIQLVLIGQQRLLVVVKNISLFICLSLINLDLHNLTSGGNMKASTFSKNRFKKVLVLIVGIILLIFLFSDCASQKPARSVSQYNYDWDNEAYRIRSVVDNFKGESWNELIGENFTAIDMDQNQTIDRITSGDISLADAQTIYEIGLKQLSLENKLKVKLPLDNKYVFQNDDFNYEIKSFLPSQTQPFNEFKIVTKNPVNPEIVVYIDHQADGVLDEILKGTMPMEKAQEKYSEMIKEGLKKGKLIQVNNTITVKEK
jgi:hypothetical protein